MRPGYGAHRALGCCCGLDLPLTPLAITDRTLQPAHRKLASLLFRVLCADRAARHASVQLAQSLLPCELLLSQARGRLGCLPRGRLGNRLLLAELDETLDRAAAGVIEEFEED